MESGLPGYFLINSIPYERKIYINQGHSAKCYRVKNLITEEIQVIKVINKSNTSINILKKEIKIHRHITDPKISPYHKGKSRIVKFLDYTVTKSCYLILLESCDRLNLMNQLVLAQKFSLSKSTKILKQICYGVSYLHSLEIIHRDLKLSNIFIKDHKIKIGDFGFSEICKDGISISNNLCGTPEYMAPEVILGIPYGYPIDVWAIGVMYYAMLFGSQPFKGQIVKQTLDIICKNIYKFPEMSQTYLPAKRLIQKIFKPIPETRISLDKIIVTLETISK